MCFLRLFFFFIFEPLPSQSVVIEAVPFFNNQLSVFWRDRQRDHPTEGIQGGAATVRRCSLLPAKTSFTPARLPKWDVAGVPARVEPSKRFGVHWGRRRSRRGLPGRGGTACLLKASRFLCCWLRLREISPTRMTRNRCRLPCPAPDSGKSGCGGGASSRRSSLRQDWADGASFRRC